MERRALRSVEHGYNSSKLYRALPLHRENIVFEFFWSENGSGYEFVFRSRNLLRLF